MNEQTTPTNGSNATRSQDVPPPPQRGNQADAARDTRTQSGSQEPDDPLRQSEVDATVAQASYARAQTLLAFAGFLLSFAIGWVAWEEHKINKLALSTTRRIERAHLAVEHIRLKGLPDQPLSVVVKLTNTGRLPATLIKVSQTLVIESPIESKPDLTQWHVVGGVIPPGGFGFSGGRFGAPNEDVCIDAEDWPRVQSGEWPLLVYGAVRYLDGFGKEEETAFGFRYDENLTDREPGARLVCINTPGFNYMT